MTGLETHAVEAAAMLSVTNGRETSKCEMKSSSRAYRETTRRLAFQSVQAKASQRGALLVPTPMYGQSICTTRLADRHPLAQHVWDGGPVRDTFTGKHLAPFFGDKKTPLVVGLEERGWVPSAAALAWEILSVDLEFPPIADGSLHINPLDHLQFSSAASFWTALRSSPRPFADRHIRAVLLPPLSQSGEDDPRRALGLLTSQLALAGITPIPSFEEYGCVCLKDVQYQLCQEVGIPCLPL